MLAANLANTWHLSWVNFEEGSRETIQYRSPLLRRKIQQRGPALSLPLSLSPCLSHPLSFLSLSLSLSSSGFRLWGFGFGVWGVG